MSTHRHVCGIDPGLDGGLALLTEAGGVVALEVMPVQRLGRGRAIDATALARLLGTWGEPVVCVETVGSQPGEGHVGAFRFGYGCGIVRGVVAALELSLIAVRPQEWRRVVLAGLVGDKGDPKAASLAYAAARWPLADLTPGRRTRPHDGLADALCLAEFGRRQIVGVKA